MEWRCHNIRFLRWRSEDKMEMVTGSELEFFSVSFSIRARPIANQLHATPRTLGSAARERANAGPCAGTVAATRGEEFSLDPSFRGLEMER